MGPNSSTSDSRISLRNSFSALSAAFLISALPSFNVNDGNSNVPKPRTVLFGDGDDFDERVNKARTLVTIDRIFISIEIDVSHSALCEHD